MTHIVSFANGVMKFGSDQPNSGQLVDHSMAQQLFGESVPPQAFEQAPVVDTVLNQVQETPEVPTVDLDGMKVADLKDYAQKNDIDITGLTYKDDILAAIKKEAE